MIICDLDATLLNSDKNVSERNLAALEACKAKGILVGLATARTQCSSSRMIEAVKPDVLVVSGGAIVKYKDELIADALLSLDTTKAMILRLLNDENVRFISMRTGEGFFVDQPVDETDELWRDYTHAKHVDFETYEHKAAEKIAPNLPWETAQAIAADFDDVTLIRFSDGDWVQYACKNATKYNGVLAAAKHLEIDVSEIVAFGDDFNDLEMLQKVGFGVAMENAIPEVKAVAGFQTSSNDNDGVAVWLESNVL